MFLTTYVIFVIFDGSTHFILYDFIIIKELKSFLQSLGMSAVPSSTNFNSSIFLKFLLSIYDMSFLQGRIIDLVKINATNFTRVTFLVFDEADRMFDMGFGELSLILYAVFRIKFLYYVDFE